MTAEQDEAFDRVVASMPTTWTCCRCNASFPFGPYDEGPYAASINYTPMTDGTMRQGRGGDICKLCFNNAKLGIA